MRKMQKFVPPPTPITVAEDEIVPFLLKIVGEAGVKQKDVASHLGVPVRTIRRLEKKAEGI